MKICQYAVNDAFKGTMAGIENNTTAIPGYEGTENHSMLVRKNPNQRFNKDHMNVISYAWVREMTRSDHAPRRGILIGGPKAAGKTTVLEQFHARLGTPVVSLTCNRRQPLTEHLKKLVPDGEGGWREVDGPIAIAMKQGYPVILNEISVMDPADTVSLHDIIDRGIAVLDSGEVIVAKRGFIVHATDNSTGYGDSTGAYADLNVMNSATLRRFFKLEMDYPPEDEELDILKGYFPQQPDEALRSMVRFANLIRAPYRQGLSTVTMGTGELIEWAECSAYFDGLSRAPIPRSAAWFGFKVVMGGIPAPDLQNARNCFHSVFNYDVSGE